MNKTILPFAAFLGLLSVLLGAFGAHGLKELIRPDQLTTFETGVKYQMYHSLVLLFVGLAEIFDKRSKKILFFSFLIGILLFSGSIYGLATNELSSFDFKQIGFITPIGGLFLVFGWLFMLLKFVRLSK